MSVTKLKRRDRGARHECGDPHVREEEPFTEAGACHQIGGVEVAVSLAVAIPHIIGTMRG